MEERLIKELAEALEMESSQINSSDRFRDFESYDSLTELSVFAMLDSEFGIELELEEFKKHITVGDLVRLVKNSTSD